MSYRAMGQSSSPNSSLPDDVAPTLVHELVQPLARRRGWVAIPTYDMREYVKAQMLTAAAGFIVGMGIGATLGNILKGRDIASPITKVVRNRRRRVRRNARRTTRRRTSARKRAPGRPSGRPADEGAVLVTLKGQVTEVRVDRGTVTRGGIRYGSIFDLGTSYRAVPRGTREVRDFGTLAGAIKHVLRHGQAMTANRAKKRRAKRAGEIVVVRETWEPEDMRFGMPSTHGEAGRRRFRSPEEAAKLLSRKKLQVSAADGSWYARESRALARGGSVLSRFYVDFPPAARKAILKHVRASSPDLVVTRAT